MRRPSITQDSPGRHPISVASVLALLPLLVGACRPSEGNVHYDLAHSLPIAETRAETRALDLGTPAARPQLLDGWSWNEIGADGHSFVWSQGESSAIELFLLEPRPLELTARAASHPALGTIEVAVEVDGRPVGRLTVGPELEVHRLSLPATSLRLGNQALGFRYPQTTAVAGGERERRLAVAWDWLQLLDPERPRPPVEEVSPAPRLAGSGDLVLPAGLQLTWPLELLPGDRLEIASVEERGRPAPRLRAWLEIEQRLHLLGEGPHDGAALVAPLPVTRPTPGLLILQSTPGVFGVGELVLHRPRVTGTPPG